jgi:hypothetical protein
MAQPLDPAVAGVASALKSLRTRAGLREERLSDTEVAFDTLRTLDSVQALMDAGEPAERAIVHAVRAAASALDPTMSIVADASLRLELSAGQVHDAELYGKDLGMRRKALLKNWDRLHQARSVAPVKPPSPRALRLDVEADALAALAVALTSGRGLGSPPPADLPVIGDEAGPDVAEPLPGSAELQVLGTVLGRALGVRGVSAGDVARELSVSVAQVSRWIEGTELPAEPEAQALDAYLTARGAVAGLVVGIRAQPRSAPVQVRLGGAPAMTMIDVFRRVGAALRGSLVRSDDGTPLGWPHDLQQLSARVTPTSTAYALRTMLLLEGHLAPDLVPVVENLRRLSSENGGYRTREQAGPRPETTASVLHALHLVDGTARYPQRIAQMEADLGEFEKSRPFILTTMLETSLQLSGSERLTELLVDSLLTARRPAGSLLLWPEKSGPLQVDPAPSVAHTARAVRALSAARAVRSDDQVGEAVGQAAAWLTEQRDFSNTSDVIERVLPDGGRVETGFTRHFTAAWVAKALVSAGAPASHPTVRTAVAQVWASYASNASLWKWDNGDLPSWMTFDAVDAFWFSSLAGPAPVTSE